MYSHRQVILHQPVKFCHNRTIGGEVISIFQDGGHRVGNLLPVSVLVMVLVREDGNLLAIVGLKLVLRFGLDRIHSFGDIVIFTALHAMQTRSSDENSVRLSVRPFVCPSVCHTRVL